MNQLSINQLLAEAKAAEDAARATNAAYIADGRNRCIGAINALPLEILAMLNPDALSPEIQTQRTEQEAIIETSIVADGWTIPIKINARWDPKSDRISGPTISIAGADIPIGNPPYDAGKIAAKIGSALLKQTAELAYAANCHRRDEIVRINNYLIKGWNLAAADIAALDAGQYPSLAPAYADYKSRRDAQSEEKLALAGRLAELTALRPAFDAELEQWELDGKHWSATWNAQCASIPVAPLYKVRYCPIAPAHMGSEDSDYTQSVVTADAIAELIVPGARCRVVDVYGNTKILYIGAFLDATEIPAPEPTITSGLLYYRSYAWGDNYVNVPPFNDTIPSTPPARPEWRTYVQTHRPDLVDLIGKEDDVPF